ncbi:hypothetical protein BC834DRAFT_160233 [Gloeopeniophorella convolvens]|nr:hypothetical protein BC834DRAFT_160233 [Gloeopeniophorella convolvens]
MPDDIQLLTSSSQTDSSFTDGSGPLFSMYNKVAAEYDAKMTESWKGDADGILIFTGLFWPRLQHSSGHHIPVSNSIPKMPLHFTSRIYTNSLPNLMMFPFPSLPPSPTHLHFPHLHPWSGSTYYGL